MEWYYEQNGAPVGPVAEAEIEAARANGAITAITRVWRQGWPDWKAAAEVWPSSYGPMAVPPPVPHERCAECGVYEPAMVTLNEGLVCSRCKPYLLARMREGVHTRGGTTGAHAVWRDGTAVVVPKDGALPNCCYKCGGEPSTHFQRTVYWHNPWLYVTILASLFIYVIIALIVRKHAKLFFPVCHACAKKHKVKMVIGTVSFIAALILLFVGVAESSEYNSITPQVMPLGIVLLLFSVIWAAAIQFVTAKKMTENYVWLKRAGKPVLDSLPQWPGE